MTENERIVAAELWDFVLHQNPDLLQNMREMTENDRDYSRIKRESLASDVVGRKWWLRHLFLTAILGTIQTSVILAAFWIYASGGA
jgi:hypothetical protein